MDKTWQLQEAKSHFSELVDRATQGEKQIVTRRGKKAAVLMGYEDYLELTQKKMSLLEALRGKPPYLDLPLGRDKDVGRKTVEF
jgi:prevent-host-death family protein